MAPRFEAETKVMMEMLVCLDSADMASHEWLSMFNLIKNVVPPFAC